MTTNPLRATALLALMLVAGVILPSSARAQQGAPADAGVLASGAVATTAAAPSETRLGPVDIVLWAPAAPFDAAPQQDRVRAGPNVALMVVGGAALVTGLIIGGDGGLIIATAGGVVGLVGLWRYLR